MRPEVAQSAEGEEHGAENEEHGAGGMEQGVELTEDEKVVMNILKEKSPVDLNELKEQTGLSNKKWDKAIKGLTKNKLAKVEKRDVGLFVTIA